MKTTFFTLSMLGALALASPIKEEKRYYITTWELDTQTITVTAARGWRSWGRPTSVTANQISAITPSASSVATAASFSPIPTSIPTSVSVVTTSSSSPPPPVAAPSSTSAPVTSVNSGSVSSYADPIIRQHNLHRANHSAPDISWDQGLADIAQQIAQSCVYAHDVKTGGGGYGQNIGAGAPPDEINAMITNQMYNNEMMLYPGYGSEPDRSNFEKWGHFSQIVWRETTSVGCYTQHCPNGLGNTGSSVSPYFTVCNYKPSGKSTCISVVK